MERLVDKCCVAMFCAIATVLALSAGMPADGLVVAVLLAVAASAGSAIMPERLRCAPVVAYAVASVVFAPLAAWLPLAAYDLATCGPAWSEGPGLGEKGLGSWPCWVWVVPAVLACIRSAAAWAVVAALACVLAVLMSVRTERLVTEAARARALRDDLRETSLGLEVRNADLRDRQDQEAHLATLAERARIAREIHDNVGHLLTRSLLQCEALLVVHRDDPEACEELGALAQTLREAMDTVRESVHDLRDDAFDLEAQVREAAEGCVGRDVRTTFSAGCVPAQVGYCFAAVAREALSNVARHSDADRVRVSFVEHPGFWRLTVADNGRVERSAADAVAQRIAGGGVGAGSGMGLASMSERVRALGGVLHVLCDGGFKVVATVPKEDA